MVTFGTGPLGKSHFLFSALLVSWAPLGVLFIINVWTLIGSLGPGTPLPSWELMAPFPMRLAFLTGLVGGLLGIYLSLASLPETVSFHHRSCVSFGLRYNFFSISLSFKELLHFLPPQSINTTLDIPSPDLHFTTKVSPSE
jgi:hypothetical protein